MIQSAKLGQLTPPEYLNCSYAQATFNNTWGHYLPAKNTSYKGKVRFMLTDHSEYGCQPIIIEYNFVGIDGGPYIHDALFNAVNDWDTDILKIGAIYEINITFRNYIFYSGTPVLLLNPINMINGN